ncbi:hypothetical protein C1645_748761 [Glomus cerebriforme]|uniref:Uncharacterized protein n=1 Tax=Glomus cerebriforme TaxID=658196 RepID=A0A397TUJ3_9GLOM|nr:hypothetical protein C1645_748761 [Glomus cerebriforme]
MIRSAMSTMSTRSLKSRSIISDVVKRKFEGNQIENILKAKSNKKVKLIENKYNDYITKEFELDIDMNPKYNNDSK